MMNATVAWGTGPAAFWAITGDRRFDYVAAMIFLGIYMYFITRGDRAFLQWGLAFGTMAGLLLLVVIGLQREIIDWPRASPAYVVEGYHSIASIIPWSLAKEKTNSSFPGDHATVMMILTALWWRGIGWKLGGIAAVAAVIFTLPRMAAGGHWLSDALIGGGTVTLLTLAIVYGTPVGWWLYRYLHRMIGWVMAQWDQAEERMVDPALGRIGPLRQMMRGLCIGMADLVPGVSGGTMAFILGIYERLIRAITQVDRVFVAHLLHGRFISAGRHVDIMFLIPLLVGVFGAIIIFSRVIPLSLLMEELPEMMFGLFFGLIAASVVDLYTTISGGARRVTNYGWIGLGLVLGIAVSMLVPVDSPDDVWFIVLCGMVAVLALLIPGVSGAFILLILGKYAATIDALGRFDYVYLAPLALGAVIGMIVFSRLVAALLSSFYHQSMLTVVGVLGGSLLVVWPFQERQYELIGEKLRLVGSTPYIPQAFDEEGVLGTVAVVVGVCLYRLLEKLARRTKAPGDRQRM